MTPESYLASLSKDGELLETAAAAGLEAVVPACPGWTVRDLVRHVRAVYRSRVVLLSGRLSQLPPRDAWADEVPPQDDAQLMEYLHRDLLDVLEALRSCPPSTPVWTWHPSDRTAAFWYRRLAHETAIHRVDAQAARGKFDSIDAALAVDGIDELFDNFLSVRRPGASVGEVEDAGDASIHLHCTDTPGEWVVRMSGESVEVSHSHEKADAALRGTSSDLLLHAWGRLGREALEVFGDEGVADRFRRVCASLT